MNAETDRVREDLEIERIRVENRKMSVDMEREYKTLRANIEHDLAKLKGTLPNTFKAKGDATQYF